MSGAAASASARAPDPVTAAGASVTAPERVGGGERFAFDFTGPKGDNDWIGVAPVGSEPVAHVDGLYVYTQDEKRYMHAPLKAAATSCAMCRRAPAVTKSWQAGRWRSIRPRRASMRRRAKASADVRVRWTGPNTPNDYIALAEPNAPIDSYLTYASIGEANEAAADA